MGLFANFYNISGLNKIFFITFVALMSLISLDSVAQQPQNNRSDRRFDRESFLIKRSAFITAELGLTPEEAAEFIPLCEELQQKKFEVGQECRKLERNLRTGNTPTEDEYSKAIRECLNVGLKEAQLEQEYYKRFEKILPPEKLYKYRHAEYKFAREFMNNPGNRKREENRNK